MPRGIPNHKLHTPGNLKEVVEADPDAVAGMSADAAEIDIEGHAVSMNDMVQSAFESSALNVDQWNALSGAERDQFIASAIKDYSELAKRHASSDPVIRSPRKPQVRQQDERAEKVVERNLPHQDEIDADKITAPVETQQGWIVPSTPQKIPEQYRR